MVIDTSAVLAILQDEPERRRFAEAIEAATTRSISAASLVEASMILQSRFGADAVRDLDVLVALAEIAIVAVDTDQAYIAREAFRDYGKGRHAAGLNFGDCFPYALARSLGAPLLFKGSDFSKTDVDCDVASG